MVTQTGTKFNIDHIRGAGPWLCKKQVINVVANMTQDNYDIVQTKVNKLSLGLRKPPSDSLRVVDYYFMDTEPEPFVDVSKCTPIALKPFAHDNILDPSLRGKVRQFEITYKFQSFTPVLLVDYFGMAAFNYRAKVKSQDVMRAKGNPTRFCSGSNYGST